MSVAFLYRVILITKRHYEHFRLMNSSYILYYGIGPYFEAPHMYGLGEMSVFLHLAGLSEGAIRAGA